jgi:uncharacterized membrane protein
MKRVNLFLIILITAIAALISTTILGFTIFANQQNPTNWMNQMWSNHDNGYGGMGSMMGQNGNTTQTTANSQWLPYFGVSFAILIALTVVGIIGIAYYLLYPQIRMGTATPTFTTAIPINTTTPSGNSAYESVTKTLTEEERKIIEVLNQHNGKYLQKYIKTETGLSRLKTHRIIARLSERGIVTLEKTGNTNQVKLADWLNKKT